MSDALQVGEDRLVSGKLSCPGCGLRKEAWVLQHSHLGHCAAASLRMQGPHARV